MWGRHLDAAGRPAHASRSRGTRPMSSRHRVICDTDLTETALIRRDHSQPGTCASLNEPIREFPSISAPSRPPVLGGIESLERRATIPAYKPTNNHGSLREEPYLTWSDPSDQRGFRSIRVANDSMPASGSEASRSTEMPAPARRRPEAPRCRPHTAGRDDESTGPNAPTASPSRRGPLTAP